mgnify:CR=1 FL=1
MDKQNKLISKAVQGDNIAFEELMYPFMKIIYNYILVHVTNHEDAEDILQDTMLGAWNSLKSYNHSSTLKTWMIGITRKKIADYYRKIYSNKQFEFVDISQLNEDTNLNTQINNQTGNFIDSLIDSIDVKNAVNILNPNDKDLLYLVFNAQLTYSEIHNITNTPIGTIKSRMHAIKIKLRPLLEDRRDNKL